MQLPRADFKCHLREFLQTIGEDAKTSFVENNACKISTNNITIIFSNTTPVTFIYNPKTNSIYTFHGHYIVLFCKKL